MLPVAHFPACHSIRRVRIIDKNFGCLEYKHLLFESGLYLETLWRKTIEICGGFRSKVTDFLAYNQIIWYKVACLGSSAKCGSVSVSCFFRNCSQRFIILWLKLQNWSGILLHIFFQFTSAPHSPQLFLLLFFHSTMSLQAKKLLGPLRKHLSLVARD